MALDLPPYWIDERDRDDRWCRYCGDNAPCPCEPEEE